MNKGELVESIAAKTSVTKKVADQILTAAIESIIESVTKGEKVVLVGFGSFEKRSRITLINWANFSVGSSQQLSFPLHRLTGISRRCILHP